MKHAEFDSSDAKHARCDKIANELMIAIAMRPVDAVILNGIQLIMTSKRDGT